ncbi:MATE family efflux transporter [Ruminococcaceae bacterium AM07-15]|nr:MATE family efflux transporter [Ruminococcaceae bacterium AM07-15]
MSKTNDLGRDPIGKLVLKLAIPSMLAQFVNVFYGIVDRMYIGHISHVGDLALAGVGVCGPIVTLISSFAFLVGLGGAPLMAIRLGEKNKEGAQKILANAFLMLCVLALLLTGAALLLKKPMLMAFGASGATYGYANEYMTIYVLGTLFAILSVGLNQYIICQGYSTMGMATVIIGAILNVLLDPVFIFLLGLGVRGAALATVISQAVSCFFVIWFLRSRKPQISLTLGGYSPSIMRRILLFGLSPFTIIATDSVLLIALNSVLQRYGGAEMGDTYITVATIVLSYMQLITMPLGGITGGTQPIHSFNYGAKKVDRIRLAIRKVLTLCLVFTGVMFLISQLAGYYFAMIFTRSEELLRLSSWAIRVFTFSVIPLAFQYEFVDTFTALGIARGALSLSLIRKAVFLVFTLALPHFLGAQATFFAEPVTDLLCAILTSAVFLSNINRLLDERLAMPDDVQLYQ